MLRRREINKKCELQDFVVAFTDGKIFSHEIPGKLYYHSSLMPDHPQGGYSLFNHLYQVQIEDILESIPNKIEDVNYYIMISWMDNEKTPSYDFFAYSLDDKNNWKSNAGIKSWFIQRGIWRRPKGKNENTCSEGIILLGEEEKLRRKINRELYLTTLLDLKEVNKMLKFR